MRDIRFSLDDLVGYSITLSARATNVAGTVTPSAIQQTQQFMRD